MMQPRAESPPARETARPPAPAIPPAEVWDRLADGAIAVRYEYCVSLLACSLRFRSRVHLLDTWEGRYIRGVPYSLLSLLLGWWGLPWGPVLTLRACWVNSCGGIDVTDEVEDWVDAAIVTAQPVPGAGPSR